MCQKLKEQTDLLKTKVTCSECLRALTHARAHTCRSQYNLQELILPVHSVGSGEQTQVVRFS